MKGQIHGLMLGICALLCACAASADPIAVNAELTDAELIQEYEAAGLAANGILVSHLTDEYCHYPAFIDPDPRLETVQAEIRQRGSRVVPALIAFLEQEVPKEREKEKNGLTLSFVSDVLQLLTQIGDPRAAPIALRILEGWDGKANEHKQRAALGALQRLTYFSFRKIKPHVVPYQDSLEHPEVVDVGHSSYYEAMAKRYREWMEGEGKEPSQWIELARKRARQLLASEDFEQVYCAATFLRPSAGRDDNPDATLARLAEIVGQMKKGNKPHRYELAGKPVPVSYANWTGMIAEYGPRARPYAATLLRIQKEQGMNNWSGYAQLRKIGGLEILTFLFEVLPKVTAEVSILEAKGLRSFTSDDPRGWWFDSQREVRFGIDRWAGRMFDSDAEREAWWKENKTKSPEEWLAANLDVLNEQVASNKRWVRAFAHEILPDMPGCAMEWEGEKVGIGKRRDAEPFRIEWLDEHRKELRYDANAGCFRLAH
ncbi:MAG: hypothetical protein FWG50_07345 [Kiritimatiellaeota bacterium]|nr:hypothetical protein [Kiritimatiellota bacterium]